ARRGRGDVRPDAVGARRGRAGRHRRPVGGAPALRRAWKIVRRLLKWGALAALALAVLLAILIYAVPLPGRLDPGVSVAVEYRDGQIATVFLSPDDKWRLPVELDRVDPAFVAALVRLEDKRFFSHPGVDPLALARALWLDLRHGRRVSGGST